MTIAIDPLSAFSRTRLANPEITVDTKYPGRSICGGVHAAGRHPSSLEYAPSADLPATVQLAQQVLSALARSPITTRGDAGWWCIVHPGKLPKDYDARNLSAWLVACSLPRGSVLTCGPDNRPFWLVESRPDCRETHLHSPRLLLDGRTVCVDESMTAAKVKRLYPAETAIQN